MIAEKKTGQARICISGREASAMLSISERTLWSLTRSGQIPAVRMGRLVRYSIADLENFVERSKSCNCSAIESNAGSEIAVHVNHPSCRCSACLIAIQETNDRRAIVLAELAAIERGFDDA